MDGRTKRTQGFPEGTMRYNLRSLGARLQLNHTESAFAKLKREAR
jgi:hypothetical protein